MPVRSVRWFWLAAMVIIADRASKYAIERLTPEGFRRALIPGFADLVHSVNAGIAFGMFSESASRWITLLLAFSAAAVIVLLAWMLWAGYGGPAKRQAGIALIIGGAAGNLLDRLLYGGVTDFLELRAGSFRWPAFNVADSAITIGAALIILDLLNGEKDASRITSHSSRV